MKLHKPTFNLNRTAQVLTIVLAVILIGGGAWAGYALGTDHGKQQSIENPPKRQSLSGQVKSTQKNGMTVTASGKEWKVTYTKTTKFTGQNNPGKGDIKTGDAVRVSGVADGDQALIAQTVAKVVPRASASPGAPAVPDARSIPGS